MRPYWVCFGINMSCKVNFTLGYRLLKIEFILLGSKVTTKLILVTASPVWPRLSFKPMNKLPRYCRLSRVSAYMWLQYFLKIMSWRFLCCVISRGNFCWRWWQTFDFWTGPVRMVLNNFLLVSKFHYVLYMINQGAISKSRFQ